MESWERKVKKCTDKEGCRRAQGDLQIPGPKSRWPWTLPCLTSFWHPRPGVRSCLAPEKWGACSWFQEWESKSPSPPNSPAYISHLNPLSRWNRESWVLRSLFHQSLTSSFEGNACVTQEAGYSLWTFVWGCSSLMVSWGLSRFYPMHPGISPSASPI